MMKTIPVYYSLKPRNKFKVFKQIEKKCSCVWDIIKILNWNVIKDVKNTLASTAADGFM